MKHLLTATLLLSVGCDSPAIAPVAEIRGAQYLTFRCVQPGAEGTLEGLPLDGCGCSERTMTGFRRMGRVECTCTEVKDGALVDVDRVRSAGGEPMRGEDGDWVSADGSTEPSVECDPAGTGNVRGYVAAVDRGEVAVLDVDEDHEVIDVDDRIPGITSVFVDDLVTDIGSHPDGDFVFTVDSTTGRLTVIREETVLPSETTDLNVSPLGQLVVWPPVERPAPTPSAQATAFITLPTQGAVLAVDLDALGAGADDVVVETYLMPGHANPGAVTIDPDGSKLFVAHAGASKVSVFEVGVPVPVALVDLVRRQPCADGYLVRVLDPEEDDSCADGIDNDLDGSVDADDSGCRDEGSEATVPGCAKLPECFDGVDNDADGLVDAADDDCVADRDWEGEVPECADGVDNDGDGLADRADDGCTNEADRVEGTAREGVGDCEDGADNDGDGLVDDQDPGCREGFSGHLRYDFEQRTECAPPVAERGEEPTDDDADGAADHPADPDCYAAADRSEASAGVEVGPAQLVAARVELADGPHAFLYVVDALGSLLRIDIGELETCVRDGGAGCAPFRRVSRMRLDSSVLRLALRNPDSDEASLLVADANGALRSIGITARVPLITDTGHAVFARINYLEDDTLGFYYVLDGVAMSLPELTDLDFRDAREVLFNGVTVLQPPEDADLVSLEIDASVVSTAGTVPLDVVRNRSSAVYARGLADPRVFQADARALLHEELNVLTFAQARTPRVGSAPTFNVRGSGGRHDVTRNPSFCQRPHAVAGLAADEQPEPVESPCIPVGFDATGQPEDVDAAEIRTAVRVSPYEGIAVPGEQPLTRPDVFTLAYEGEIPRSESRTGQYGGLNDDGWALLDYDVDYCRLGVEEGDVLLVDFFVPEAASGSALSEEELLSRCARFELTNATADPTVNREPLRWVVRSRTAHRLELVRDTRLDYNPQLQQDDRTPLPRLASPPASPPPECAAELISYRIRAGHDQWLLSGRVHGYRHPWVNREGQCEAHPTYVADRRVGRARLGEPFESEVFNFTLGALAESETTEGVPANRLPYMVDVAFEWDFFNGRLTRRLSEVIVQPGEMRWLPSDDHLYVVDGAAATVAEIAGLDALIQSMQLVRRIR